MIFFSNRILGQEEMKRIENLAAKYKAGVKIYTDPDLINGEHVLNVQALQGLVSGLKNTPLELFVPTALVSDLGALKALLPGVVLRLIIESLKSTPPIDVAQSQKTDAAAQKLFEHSY